MTYKQQKRKPKHGHLHARLAQNLKRCHHCRIDGNRNQSLTKPKDYTIMKKNKITVRGRKFYLNGVEIGKVHGWRYPDKSGPGYWLDIPALNLHGSNPGSKDYAFFKDAVKWGKIQIENALKENKLTITI